MPEDRLHEIDRAAAQLFRERGYHATSLRDIAEAVGIRAPSLYNHIASKQELLYRILASSMDALIAHTRERLARAAPDPEARLRAFVRALVEIQAGLRLEAALMIEELRALEPPYRAEIVEKRDRYQAMLEDILRHGRRAGVFAVRDVKVTAYAIVAMGRGVADWFDPQGRLGVAAVARAYAELAARMARG